MHAVEADIAIKTKSDLTIENDIMLRATVDASHTLGAGFWIGIKLPDIGSVMVVVFIFKILDYTVV